MEEIWKAVSGYEGIYEVSNIGNVRSLDRITLRNDGVEIKTKGKVLTRTLNQDGYPTVHLSRNGFSERVTVHVLVARAFVGNPLGLKEVNHKDFDRTNSNADNLEWVEHGDNVRYSIAAGRHFCCGDISGVNNPNYGGTKLKEFYAKHPEEKIKLGRKGKQNGRAMPVSVILPTGETLKFDFLRECANYLIKNGFSNAKSLNTVSDRISKALRSKSTYLDCQFI